MAFRAMEEGNGAIEKVVATEWARPSFLVACQKPRTKAEMPVGIVCLTYSTACK